MAVVWIHINCNAGTLFIQHQCFSLKNFAKQQRSLYVTAVRVGMSVGFWGGNLACSCAPPCGHVWSDNHYFHMYAVLQDIRTCSFIKPDTVASHFAFPYTNWKRKMCFHARFSSEEKHCNS